MLVSFYDDGYHGPLKILSPIAIKERTKQVPNIGTLDELERVDPARLIL